MKRDSDLVKEQRLIGYDNALNFLPYYTSDVWSRDEKYFVFYCQKDGRISLNTYSPGKDSYERVLDLDRWASSAFSKKDRYADMVCSSLVRDTETVLISFDNQICHVSIPGKSVHFSKAKFPEGTLLTGPFNVSQDGKYLTGVNLTNSDALPKKTSLFVYEITTEEIVFLKEFEFWANHPQFFANSDRILFCHEGATERIPDRMHLLEWRLGLHYPIYPQQHNTEGELIECIGHEMIAGDKAITVRYPVSKMASGAIILVDPMTKNGEVLDHDDYMHVASNAAGDLFVMDTCWWGNTVRKTDAESDVILFDNRTKEKSILATVCCTMNNQAYHVHPRLNMKGDIVLCSSKESVSSDNAKILYLQL